MVEILIMCAKVATLGLKIKKFWNKDFYKDLGDLE